MTEPDPSAPDAPVPIRYTLVTGASGFVGSALVRQLVSRGRPVAAAARSPLANSTSPLLRQHSGLDLAAETDWSAALAQVDTVIHCAARVHMLNDRASDPLTAFRQTNLGGTVALAEQAANAGVRRFVFVSTVGVLGANTHGQPFCADSPAHPHSPYAVSKWEAEQALHAISQRTDMEAVVIRPPMVIGANAPGNFARLLGLIDRGLPLPIATVNNRRSFVALGNLVDLLCHVVVHPKASGGTYLVSDGEDLSTTELLRRTTLALGRPMRLFPFPATVLRWILQRLGRDELAQSLLGSLQVDVTTTCKALNWAPPFTIDSALREAALAYQRRPSLA